MTASAAIADPLHDGPSAGGLAPRALDVLHTYASGPQDSARRSRNAAQRFRNEPSRMIGATRLEQSVGLGSSRERPDTPTQLIAKLAEELGLAAGQQLV